MTVETRHDIGIRISQAGSSLDRTWCRSLRRLANTQSYNQFVQRVEPHMLEAVNPQDLVALDDNKPSRTIAWPAIRKRLFGKNFLNHAAGRTHTTEEVLESYLHHSTIDNIRQLAASERWRANADTGPYRRLVNGWRSYSPHCKSQVLDCFSLGRWRPKVLRRS